MSTSNPTELPTEILEQILLRLPGQDIIKIVSVNRRLRDLIRNSPTLQYRCELFATGLIDNPCSPCDLDERRKLCEGYVHKWSKAASLVESTQRMPPSKSWDRADYLGNGYFVFNSLEHHDLAFLHIPPAASRKPVKRWSIPLSLFPVFGYTAYPPENVLAISEQKENLIRIHLLNLQDGSPYYPPPSNAIAWELPPRAHSIRNGGMAITSSRVMIHCPYGDEDLPGHGTLWRILVWNWRTGDLVLDFTFTNGEDPQVVFLDEFRMVLLPDTPGSAEFTVFDTLIPQDRAGNSRRLGLPQRFQDWITDIRVDHDRPLGTPNKDEPFIADPAQAVLVVNLMRDWGPGTFLVVRTQALIEQTNSMCVDSHVPWGEWGRGAVVIEVPARGGGLAHVFVHGAQVMVVGKYPSNAWDSRGDYKYGVQKLDFTWRGRSSLPFLDRESGGTERSVRALFERKRCIGIKPDGGMSSWGELRSSSDGRLFYLGGGYVTGLTLHVWELV